MARRFTNDDAKMPVVTEAGRTIGTVRTADEETATVERTDDHDSLTGEIKEMLGWSDDDEVHELDHEHVDREEDNRPYLKPRR